MAASDDPYYLLRARAERRRAFAGIEDPEAAGGAGANVDQAPAVLDGGSDFIHHLGNLRQIGGDRLGYQLVLLVDNRQHVDGGQGVYIGAIGIAALGQQCAQVDTHHKTSSVTVEIDSKELIIPFM